MACASHAEAARRRQAFPSSAPSLTCASRSQRSLRQPHRTSSTPLLLHSHSGWTNNRGPVTYTAQRRRPRRRGTTRLCYWDPRRYEASRIGIATRCLNFSEQDRKTVGWPLSKLTPLFVGVVTRLVNTQWRLQSARTSSLIRASRAPSHPEAIQHQLILMVLTDQLIHRSKWPICCSSGWSATA